MHDNFIPVNANGTFTRSVIVDKILSERDKNRSTYNLTINYKSDLKTIAEVTHSLNPVHVYQGFFTDFEQSAIVEVENKNFILISHGSGSGIYRFDLIGDYDWIMAFKADHEYLTTKKATVQWHYMHKGDLYSKTFDVDPPLPIYDEFYPYIENGFESYLEDYMSSDASILVMIGEPGTGKTNLLRHLMFSRCLTATFTFDENVMANEQYFINFATADDRTNLMIVEDADLILNSRQSDQNRLMAKLLNVSDGIVRLVRKKMIFTTNLSNANKIDPALLRSGRCFDALHFRALTETEALKVAEKAGIKIKNPKKEMTLAEVFGGHRSKDASERFKLLKSA